MFRLIVKDGRTQAEALTSISAWGKTDMSGRTAAGEPGCWQCGYTERDRGEANEGSMTAQDARLQTTGRQL